MYVKIWEGARRGYQRRASDWQRKQLARFSLFTVTRELLLLVELFRHCSRFSSALEKHETALQNYTLNFRAKIRIVSINV